MNFIRLIAGRRVIAGVILAAAILPSRTTPLLAQPAEFPFDQNLLLDTPPMRPGKRMPTLTVARNGNAIVDLWCKSVAARAELTETSIKLEAAPLPEELPQMQGAGQCTPERQAADVSLLEKLTQATGWQLQGGTLVLEGPTPLRFRAGSN